MWWGNGSLRCTVQSPGQGTLRRASVARTPAKESEISLIERTQVVWRFYTFSVNRQWPYLRAKGRVLLDKITSRQLSFNILSATSHLSQVFDMLVPHLLKLLLLCNLLLGPGKIMLFLVSTKNLWITKYRIPVLNAAKGIRLPIYGRFHTLRILRKKHHSWLQLGLCKTKQYTWSLTWRILTRDSPDWIESLSIYSWMVVLSCKKNLLQHLKPIISKLNNFSN